MTRLPFNISRKAPADLKEIWRHTVTKWSEEQADRYYNLIFDGINDACNHPDTGKSLEHIRKNYRAAKVKSHPNIL